MWKTKTEAFRLRRTGQSYSQISQKLGIPKSTLGGWFKNEPWSHEIRDRLGAEVSLAFPQKLANMVKANKERWAKQHKAWQDQAVQEFPGLRDNPLFLAGLMLYWGEGDKTFRSNTVRLANIEPEMIRLFRSFLIRALAVPEEKITAWLLLYPDLIENVQKNFWSRAAGIPLSQFKKSIYIKGRHPTKRLSYGVCTVQVHSRELKEKIIKWLELYPDYFRALAIEKAKK